MISHICFVNGDIFLRKCQLIFKRCSDNFVNFSWSLECFKVHARPTCGNKTPSLKTPKLKSCQFGTTWELTPAKNQSDTVAEKCKCMCTSWGNNSAGWHLLNKNNAKDNPLNLRNQYISKKHFRWLSAKCFKQCLCKIKHGSWGREFKHSFYDTWWHCSNRDEPFVDGVMVLEGYVLSRQFRFNPKKNLPPPLN